MKLSSSLLVMAAGLVAHTIAAPSSSATLPTSQKTCSELGLKSTGLMFGAPCYEVCRDPDGKVKDKVIQLPEGTDCGKFMLNFPMRCTAHGLCTV